MTDRSRKRRLVWAILHLLGTAGLVLLATSRLQADAVTGATGAADAADQGRVALAAGAAFAETCFDPFLTAAGAAELLEPSGARVDFYDLAPLAAVEPSPATVRAATFGSDRRCELAFDGDFTDIAVSAALAGLMRAGIRTGAPLPDRYHPTDGTALLAARQLNPRRIAVVHVGTRAGPHGPETFLAVERLMPLEPMQ